MTEQDKSEAFWIEDCEKSRYNDAIKQVKRNHTRRESGFRKRGIYEKAWNVNNGFGISNGGQQLSSDPSNGR